MERLSGIDANFLYTEVPTVHMHTLKVAVIAPTPAAEPYSFDRVKDQLRARLHLLPTFRRRIVPVPFDFHHPVWIEDPDFDIDRHVWRAEVPAPRGQHEIEQVIGEIASKQLDRSRPLWELWILDGLPDDRIVALVKLHHLMADGTAAAHLLANAMTTSAEAHPIPTVDWAPEEIPAARRLLLDAFRDHLRQLFRLPSLLARTVKNTVKTALHRRTADNTPPIPILHTPKTAINSALTARRSFATTSIPLAAIKDIRRAAGVTVNDVLLAAVSGSLRGYLMRRGELPDRSLVAEVPIATDSTDAPPRLAGNRVSNIFTTLATDIADPAERLRTIHAVTRTAKELEALMGHEMYREWSEYSPPGPVATLMRQMSRFRLAERSRPAINVIVSSVRGPDQTLYWSGNELRGLYSVGPILEGVALNITAWSYLDQLNVTALVCPDVVPDPYEILDGLRGAVDELTAIFCASVP